MNQSPRTRTLLSTLLSLLLLLLTAGFLFVLGGCSEGAAPRPEQDSSETTSATAPEATAIVYEVRGQVVELPDPDDPLSSFYVHHEAIDEFRNMEGEIQGMDSMTMPFPVADDVGFEGITVGDSITMSLMVNWEADPVIQVTRVEKLDPGAELDFREARPPGSP